MKKANYILGILLVVLAISCKTSVELMDRSFAKSGLKYDPSWRTNDHQSLMWVKEEWRMTVNNNQWLYPYKVTPGLYDSAHIFVAPIFRIDLAKLVKTDTLTSVTDYLNQCPDSIMYYLCCRVNNGQINKCLVNGRWEKYNRDLTSLGYEELFDSLYFKCNYPLFKVIVDTKGTTYEYMAYVDKKGSMFYFDVFKSLKAMPLYDLLHDTWSYYYRKEYLRRRM